MNRNVIRKLKTLCVLAPALLGVNFLGASHSEAQKTQPTDKEFFSILNQKCIQCHGEAVQMANLDLRRLGTMLKGGEKGPAIVPGNAEASLIYRRVAGLDKPRMPMAPLPPLTPREIAVLKSWIDRVSSVTAKEEAIAQSEPSLTQKPVTQGYKEKAITVEDRSWWSFRKPARRPIPKATEARWRANPIDAFIKKSLDQKGLKPAPQADRNTLIRRAYLDLTGLLPSPGEVDAFVNDSSPLAYEKLIERLLDSPRYGERWGRFWLDVTRYADSSGYEHDYDIANAWRYRDYVIKSFNEDKPYNRFIIEQLAGDELDDQDYDSLIATTFYRIGPRVRYREKDNPYYRYEYLDDTIRTTFQGFMGLSVNCARCHDHKFDPISRMDYYRTMAMLFGAVEYDHKLAPPEKIVEYEKARKEVEDQVRPLMRKVFEIEAPYRKAAFEKRLQKFPEEIQVAVRTPEEKRTPGQTLLAAQIVSLDIDPDAAANQNVSALYSRQRIKVNDADQVVRERLLDQVEEIIKRMPPPLPMAEGVRDGDYRLTPDGRGDEPLPGKGNRFDYGVECCFLPQPGQPYNAPPVYFGANGLDVAEDQKSFVVEPGYLSAFVNGAPSIASPPKNGPSSGRRRALAQWIASPDNPLTARVMVNRIWHWHFGRGVVPTPSNFGKMGAKPSHPELLDWLATEFIRQGWSVKRLHRVIMNSETYKQASPASQAVNLEKDPTNIYLWRFPLRRLEAEAIRDVILSASGQINLQAGGQPFFPAIPKSVRESYLQGKWVMTQEEPSTWRRSVYAYWKRGLKYPMFEVHDQPDPNVTCEMRNTTTVPTQALTLLNNEFVLIQAGRFAERVIREAGADSAKQIRLLYRIALGRAPERKELDQSSDFLQKQLNYHATSTPIKTAISDPALAALTDLAHVMLNSNEFVYIN
ncbi:MAG TPA: PSD1 and planctomycete cytochrome C domain-containing protein [Blastocatellia bacterium]|nr:PSD1 and planctomycete cytochrome C domain-containing protein [Blastocatellia bacterium]